MQSDNFILSLGDYYGNVHFFSKTLTFSFCVGRDSQSAMLW